MSSPTIRHRRAIASTDVLREKADVILRALLENIRPVTVVTKVNSATAMVKRCLVANQAPITAKIPILPINHATKGKETVADTKRICCCMPFHIIQPISAGSDDDFNNFSTALAPVDFSKQSF